MISRRRLLFAPLTDEDPDIFVRPPRGFEATLGGVPAVWRLRRALYGLRQSPRRFGQLLSKWLTDYGFTQSAADRGVYVYRRGELHFICVVYVDDLLIAGKDKAWIASFMSSLGKRFTLKVLGPVALVLGLEVRRDRKRRELLLHQSNSRGLASFRERRQRRA